MTYKYDPHVHTAEASACASASGAEQARRYKAEGYDGIFITDHFFNGNCAIPEDLPWGERVDLYCRGYENAKAEGDRIGIKVFFGIEYSHRGADILVYGLDKQWLYDHPDCDKDLFVFHRQAKEAGALMIHAHPFREAPYLKGMVLLMPELVDGVEVYNSGNREESNNRRAEWYAEEFGFSRIAGTDNHHLSVESGRLAGVFSEVELTCEEDLAKAFFDGMIRPAYPEQTL